MTALMIEDGTEFPTVTPVPKPTRDFLVVVERTVSGWSAYLPDLDGVVAAASSEDEVRALIVEAVRFHVDGLLGDGEELPEARSFAFRTGADA